jgi:hypothetical protein
MRGEWWMGVGELESRVKRVKEKGRKWDNWQEGLK